MGTAESANGDEPNVKKNRMWWVRWMILRTWSQQCRHLNGKGGESGERGSSALSLCEWIGQLVGRASTYCLRADPAGPLGTETEK